MMDRAKRLQILVESNRRSLKDIDWAIEALETGSAERTSYSAMQRAFHTIKHDAAHLQLQRLSRLAGAAEAIIARAHDRKVGLPLELLHAAAKEIGNATETIARGGRHQLDEALLLNLEEHARTGQAE